MSRVGSQWRLARRMLFLLAAITLNPSAIQADDAVVPLWTDEGLAGWRRLEGGVVLDDGAVVLDTPRWVMAGCYPTRTVIMRGQVNATGAWRLGVGWLAVGRDAHPRWQDAESQWLRLKTTSGQWCDFTLTLRGEQLEMSVGRTDRRVVRMSRLREPAIPIFIVDSKPGGLKFRHVELVDEGFASLMQSPAQWQAADGSEADNWQIASEKIVCRGGKGTWLRTAKSYDDFELRLEYRLREGGNSGVYVRVPKDGNHHGVGAGLEVQILDDRAARYRRLKPYQYCASLYAIAPAWPRVGFAPGQWNSLSIVAQGTRYRVIHNGVLVVDADGVRFPELYERRRAGWVGLQNHHEHVEFRNIRIRALSHEAR